MTTHAAASREGDQYEKPAQEHTPGPWVLYGPTTVTKAGGKFHRIADAIEAADARLIAAAPDFLDLARNVGGFDDGLLKSADLNVLRAALTEYRDQARAALDKAEGR